jgi:hypothetical protein
LPACTPDIQKAFYSLLLERRIGEHRLPPGSWVVAAGNRAEDRALVRTISSALVNRVTLLHIRVDLPEWMQWGEANGIRNDVRSYIRDNPLSLLRDIPREPVPFSTPRSWTLLSQALDLAEQAGILDFDLCQALAAGRISAEDVQPFCNWWHVNQVADHDVSAQSMDDLLSMSLRDLGLSHRATSLLELSGLGVIRDLVVRTENELLANTEVDHGHIADIRACLAERGLWLGMEF